MALRVQPVPAPAAGRDWTFTVPSNYSMDVVAIQATLATPANISSAVDSSGNGLSLTVQDPQLKLAWGAPGPYGGGANNYALNGAPAFDAFGTELFTALSALLGGSSTSIEAIVNLATGADLASNWIAVRQLGPNVHAALELNPNNADPADCRGDAANVFFSLATGFLPRGAWHHVAATADGANWRLYLDGALSATVAGHQPPAATSPQYFIAAANPAFRGRIAGVAVTGATLSGAQVANHSAARGSNAAYKAAVLADTPAGLWMLDDTGSMGSRKATLAVTDGTTEVARYPGGALAGVNGFYTWTWASQAPSTSQSADATVNLVQIPDLKLPPGYTLGTVTPDLGLADSWTNINIWWDDGTIGPGGPVGPADYIDALILPDKWNG